MPDREPDPYTVEWRVSKLEAAQDELRSNGSRQLAEHRTATDAMISAIREQLRNDYPTRDQADVRYLSRETEHRGGVVRREWLLVLIAAGNIAMIGLQIFFHH